VAVVTALWFASRATGLVSLVLLTAVMALGALSGVRLATPRCPRFVLAGLHRNLSLLSLLFLAVHIATAIIDPYAGIRWTAAIVPFVSKYHPFWLGLGTISVDLLLALVITSVARSSLGPRTWRATHWAAYACWPIAVLHGWGIGGADSRLGWVLTLTIACVLVVLICVAWRVYVRHPDSVARSHFKEAR
jgi:predicted ferric reductase